VSTGPVFNVSRIVINNLDEKYKKKIGLAQYMLDNQVMKDSNYFIPLDSAALRDSTLLASDVGKGRIVWNTKYARRLYYNPQYNFAKDKNPNARGLWFEAAKTMNKSKWTELVKNIILKGDS
jgi:hypothetical protein